MMLAECLKRSSICASCRLLVIRSLAFFLCDHDLTIGGVFEEVMPFQTGRTI